MNKQGIRRRVSSIAGIGSLPLVAALVVAPMLALGPGKAAADFAAPTFRSTIVINDNGPASPYGSTVTVGGLRGNVVDVNVILNNFSHDRPEDVAVMLAYRGRAATLMRGAGGTAAVRNANILLNDEATEALPATLPLAGGTAYRPVDYTRIPATPIGEPFGGLAPDPNDVAGEYLDFFDGLTPNGEWTLWVRDDRANFFGSMSGWTLEIVATFPPAGSSPGTSSERSGAGRCPSGPMAGCSGTSTSGGTKSSSPRSSRGRQRAG